MSTKFYVNSEGDFLGCYGDGAMPPDGAVEVSVPPPHGQSNWDGQKWTAKNVVPAFITKRQAIKALMQLEIISLADGEAWAISGTPPAVIKAVIDKMPETDRVDALIDFGAAQVFEREHPLIAGLQVALKKSDAEIDAIFSLAGGI